LCSAKARRNNAQTKDWKRRYEVTIAPRRRWDNTVTRMVRVIDRLQERRAEPRYRVNEYSVLRSTGDIAAVRVLDISATGLRVSSVTPIPVNTPVEIQLDGAKIAGLVKNCYCQRVQEFQLGILAGTLQVVPTRLDHLAVLRRAKAAHAAF